MSDTKLAEKDAHRFLRLRAPKDARAIAVMATANHLSVYAAAERFYGTAWNWHRREEKRDNRKLDVLSLEFRTNARCVLRAY
jgi:hypothetical protein